VGEIGPVQRQAILSAALHELLLRGIDDFTLECVADRAGVDPAVIIQEWGDRRVLLMDAMFSEGRQQIPIPDTGSLAGDFEALAAALSALAALPLWRASFRRGLPANSRYVDFTDIRADFRRARIGELAVVIERAAERGEVRGGIDPEMAMKMFFPPTCPT